MKEPRYRIENGQRYYPHSHVELIHYVVWRLGICRAPEVAAELRTNYGRSVTPAYVSLTLRLLTDRGDLTKVSHGVYSPRRE